MNLQYQHEIENKELYFENVIFFIKTVIFREQKNL